jgi:hypothetical protein
VHVRGEYSVHLFICGYERAFFLTGYVFLPVNRSHVKAYLDGRGNACSLVSFFKHIEYSIDKFLGSGYDSLNSCTGVDRGIRTDHVGINHNSNLESSGGANEKV